jgi:hypothetical protein
LQSVFSGKGLRSCSDAADGGSPDDFAGGAVASAGRFSRRRPKGAGEEVKEDSADAAGS